MASDDATSNHRRPLGERMSICEHTQRDQGVRLVKVETAIAEGAEFHARVDIKMENVQKMAREMRDHVVWFVRLILGGVCLAGLSLLVSSCMRMPRITAAPRPGDAGDAPGSYTLLAPTGGDLSPLLQWAAYIGAAGVLLMVVLAIALPIKRDVTLTLAAAAGGLLVASYALGHLLAWLPLISLALALGGMAYLIYILYDRLTAATDTVDLLADKDDPTWPAMRDHIILAQGGEDSPRQRDLDRLAHQRRKAAQEARHGFT